MKHLYVCRHGESVFNAQHIFAGQTDTPLTDRGREQARAAGRQAETLSFDTIVSSPLSRAMETAQIIADSCRYPHQKIIVEDIFKERSLGNLEGRSWDEFEEPHDHDDESDIANGIETDVQLLARAEKGLELLRSLPADTILLVGHGSFILALCKLLNYNTGGQELPNAHIVELT